MSGTPKGFLGNLVARRPQMITGIFMIGCAALVVIGGRQGVGAFQLSYNFLINLLLGLATPIALAVTRPAPVRIAGLWALFIISAFAGAYFLYPHAAATMKQFLPGRAVIAGGGFFFAYLMLLNPVINRHYRLVALAPLALAAGGAAVISGFAIAGALSARAPDLIVLLFSAAMVVGAGSGFDFARFFAKGASRENAGAAASHAALAPAVFAISISLVGFAMISYRDNIGLIDWTSMYLGAISALGLTGLAVVVVAGALAWSGFGESVAVDENYARRWFAQAWAPVRRVLPPTTAIAASVIALMLAIIAGFEAGLTAPVTLLVLVSFVAVGALVAFVSVRTSLLLSAVIAMATYLAHYAFSLIGMAALSAEILILVACLVSMSMSQITTSWRDANLRWRNARDAAEDALGGGMRKALLGIGASAIIIVVAGSTFQWAQVNQVLIGFLATAFFALLIAPIMMIALSDRTRG